LKSVSDVIALERVTRYLLAGVGLTSRGTTKEEGHLAVSHSLLGQVIVDDEGVLAIVSEPLNLTLC
jgi:hypothetical protein